jgi:hypothetical protein
VRVGEVQDLTVPDTLRGEGARGVQRGAVGAAQHPAAGQGTGVREVLTGVFEQPRQQFSERRPFRQREVDPSSGRRDGHPDEASGVHIAPLASASCRRFHRCR